MQLHQLAWVNHKPGHLSLRHLSCIGCPCDEACSHFDAGFAELNLSVSNSTGVRADDENISPEIQHVQDDDGQSHLLQTEKCILTCHPFCCVL
jgi:hypothetical protein